LRYYVRYAELSNPSGRDPHSFGKSLHKINGR